MFGFFKTYNNEADELYDHLINHWDMRPEYARAFLDAYRKSLGRLLAKGRERMSMLENSDSPDMRMTRNLSRGEDEEFALVGRAYQAYMEDLRRGRHVGTKIEMAIWAVLVNRTDLVEHLDGGFARYIDSRWEEEFPSLLEEVFVEPDDA